MGNLAIGPTVQDMRTHFQEIPLSTETVRSARFQAPYASRSLAVAAAVVAASAVWSIGRWVGIDMVVPEGDGTETIALWHVVRAVLPVSLLGWVVLAALEHWAPRRARVIWASVAVAVTLLSLVPVLSLDADADVRAVLTALHLTVPLFLVPLLLRRPFHAGVPARRSASR